nr:immunoglobulin light chain junction region [Macaca mulatta]
DYFCQLFDTSVVFF